MRTMLATGARPGKTRAVCNALARKLVEGYVRKPSDADRFHAHLDACQRCREQPFNLCPVGALLLRKAAMGTAEVTRAVLRAMGARA